MNKLKTFASLFSGCGGADQGARQAGLEHLWGVELCAKPAAIAQSNGFNLYIEDVLKSDFSDRAKYPSPDWLHASPPCQNASIANHKSGETKLDMELALAINGAISELSPDYFSLENVEGYRHFKSFEYIIAALNNLDYSIWIGVLNAANYGVPQTRKRLFLIARREGQAKPPMPTHQSGNEQMSMFCKPWQGWGSVVSGEHSDRFSDRMKAMLPKGDFERSLFTGFKDGGVRRSLNKRLPNEPSPTLLASMDRPSLLPWICERDGGFLDVMCVDCKGMAALQGFPANYLWGDDIPAARKSIGNSVCPPLMEAIIRAQQSR